MKKTTKLHLFFTQFIFCFFCSLILLILLLMSSFNVQAQINNFPRAIQLIQKNQIRIFKNKEEFKKEEIAGTYYSISDKMTMVYLQQKYKSLPVFSCMKVLAFKEDSLLSVADNYFNFQGNEIHENGNCLISPEMAVMCALKDQSIEFPDQIILNKTTENKYNFGTAGVCYHDIVCELIWLPINSTLLKKVWQIELTPLNTSDHLLIRVDACDNIVLDKNNYTVYENFDEDVSNNEKNKKRLNGIDESGNKKNQPIELFSIYRNARYRVINYPFESPSYLSAGSSMVINPWQNIMPLDSFLKWHFDGNIVHDSTRGNNVWAQEDRDNNNSTFGKTANSVSTNSDLNFDYNPDYTDVPTKPNTQQFAVTNLFYWNNLMHDLSYQYGFDEASGNFQMNNFDRGGVGNDFVIADAQDAGRFNNANFTTPTDGFSPRMQMYLFNSTLPFKDADLDNGIIVHEYAHGISNRLTGGPSNCSCLSNAEQPGEGWSDYFALMMTTNWRTSNIQYGSIPRTLGTYVLGQPITGRGVRSYPYSVDKSINPLTYGMMASTGGEVHKIGEIWCAALWDMTWNLISMEGINPDLFNPNVSGGNSIALKLVIEGMRLQPCRPGFIDARNAILKADSIFFNAKYSCVIWSAFAGRGMGKNAKQGSSNNTRDQIEDFLSDAGLQLMLTQNLSEQYEGGLVTFYNYVKASKCYDIVNSQITDTLPLNVDYVSGGNYDSASRVIHFNINLRSGESNVFPFTIRIKRDAYFSPLNLLVDSVKENVISGLWQDSTNDTNAWSVSSEESNSHPFSLFSCNYGYISDRSIQTTEDILLPLSSSPLFDFQSNIQSELNWDGGVVEISTDSGMTWNDVGNSMMEGFYNGKINVCGNPLAGRSAFTGNSNGFVKTVIDLTSYAGKFVKIRFRFASDETNFSKGWFLDDIHLVDTAVVNMKSTFLDSVNLKHENSNVSIKILPPLPCIPAAIILQPDGLNLCEGGVGKLSIHVQGTTVLYQWQISTDGGVHFHDIPAAKDSVLDIGIVTAMMNFYVYRCVVTNACSTTIISNTCLLTVYNLPSVDSVFNFSKCGQGSVNIQVPADTNEIIEWYLTAFSSEIINTASFFQTPILTSNSTYWFKKRNIQTGCITNYRFPVVINILSQPDVPFGRDSSRCGAGQVFLKAFSSASTKIFWYDQIAEGNLLDSGSEFRTPVISVNTTYYAVSKSPNGCISQSRTAFIAKINHIPMRINSVMGSVKCSGESAILTALSSPFHLVRWYADSTDSTLLQTASSTGLNNFFSSTVQNTTTYWVANYNSITGCISSEKKPVIAFVNPRPAAPIINSNSRCGTGTVVLSVLSPSANINYDWYDISSGGTSLYTSSFVATPVISTSTNYYVESRNLSSGCTSVTRSLAKATVYSIPNPPVAVGSNSRCGSGNMVLKVLGNRDLSFDWYSVSFDGIPIKVNSDSLNLNNISISTNYYVASRDVVNGCISSARTKITSTVLPILPSPASISGFVNICPFVNTSNSVVYTTTQVQGASNYKWTIPFGALLDSGSNGIKIRVRYISNTANDTISVQAYNGCLGSRKSLKLNTNACLPSFVRNKIIGTKNASSFDMVFLPNPTENQFAVRIISESREPVTITIYNLQGKKVKIISYHVDDEIKLGDDLFSGVYFAECKQGKFCKRIKIMKVP